MASTTEPRLITPKQPAEVIDYNFDWTALLAETSDTISAATVTVDIDTLTLGDTIRGDTIVKQWVSGGLAGITYKLTCFITTAAGRMLEAEIFLRLREV